MDRAGDQAGDALTLEPELHSPRGKNQEPGFVPMVGDQSLQRAFRMGTVKLLTGVNLELAILSAEHLL